MVSVILCSFFPSFFLQCRLHNIKWWYVERII
jgi:hypothetical protein